MNTKANSKAEANDVLSDAAAEAIASPQETTIGAASTPPADEAGPEQPASDAGGRQTDDGAAGTHTKKASHTKKSSHTKKTAKKPKRDSGRRDGAGSRTDTGGPSLRERLLAPVDTPTVALDRTLLPEPLLGPLDAAGLGDAALLSASAFMMLAGISAVAGPNVRFAPTVDPRLEMLCTGSSLRIAVLGEQHAVPFVPGGILDALYAVENDLLAVHEQSAEHVAWLRRMAAERRRLHDQASRATARLGLAPLAPLQPEEMPPAAAARPRIVLIQGASSAIVEAGAGGTGVVVIDSRWVKSMSVGLNLDRSTADLLSTLALGHAVPVTLPGGRTAMKSLPASVFGQFSDRLSLGKAASDHLLATVFVKAATAPLGGDAGGLVGLTRRISAITKEPVVLHLPAKARTVLAAAAANWKGMAAQAMPPLSDFIAGLPDLARRLAVVLHLVDCSTTADGLPLEIPAGAVKRAAALIEGFVLPMARGVLGPVSCEEAERDGLLMVAHLRQIARKQVAISRRTWMRNWQNAMPHSRFEVALNLLLSEKILLPTKGEDSGKWYSASSEIHNAA